MTDSLQSIRDALPFGPQFLCVRHMTELAAAALAVKRAGGFNPFRRGEEQIYSAAASDIFVCFF